jgi:YVTN family beta-propeller protein
MQFRVLGPLEVQDGEQALTLAGAKQRQLLALLLLRANEVVSRHRLIAALWGEETPGDAEHSLEAHVSRLRKLLHRNGQDVVLTRPGGYVLSVDEGDLDLSQFERLADEGRAALRDGGVERAARLLREAVSLWRGPALEDVACDSFAVADIRDIEDRRIAAYEDLIEAELGCGRQVEILPEVERLVRDNPLRERLHVQLMLALYRSGRQADALDAYRNARRRFADELGIEPGPELRELEQAILRQDDRLASPVYSAPSGPARARGGLPRLLVAGVLAAAAALAGGIAALLTLGGTSQALAHVDANAVGLINPKTGRIADQVPVDATPSHFAVGEGAVWVTNADADTVSRIDPLRWIRVQTITVGSGPSGITTGKGAVWVANSLDGTVSRIDPVTNTVVQKIFVGNGPAGVAFGARSVWVANAADRTIARIDALSGKVKRRIDVSANELVFGSRALWATSTSSNSVSRIDPGTNTVVRTINVGNGPAGVVLGHGSVWVGNNLDGTVSRIDPTTNAVAATIPVGGGPRGIAVGAGGIWVSDESGGTVAQIDPRSNQVVQRLEVGNRPTGVAVDDVNGRVLIGVRASGAGHRGGTLTMRTNGVLDSIDTGVAYDVGFSWPILSMTGDGLTGFERAGGSEGTQVVPDLAVSIPSPTNLGRTYTFQLRPNIRYSSGRLVKASDIRYALERHFRLGSASSVPAFYDGIVGAAACTKAPRRCDLSKGIVVDDAANTVTFHLIAPDPEFLYKLALPWAYAVPAGTPARDVGTHPLPATGPYVIGAYRPNHLLRLVRNTHFHEWSKAAQPAGYPDEIVVRIGGTADEALAAVERGRADVLGGARPSADRLGEARTRFASRLHTHPRPAIVGFFMNTRLPPFDDVNVRRALNYAADRAVAVGRLGGPEVGQPACQVLPPNFPGYQPYCPYTTGSDGSGQWVAPDLAKARRLVAGSSTKGTTVTVWFPQWARIWLNGLGPYMVRLLHSLGYRASVRLERPSTKPRQEQVGFVGWGADYPSPWDFLTPLSCGIADNGWAQFCDPSIDRQKETARAMEATNPQAANLLWARIDRRIVDDAPWLPLVTPKKVDFLSNRVGNYQYSPQWTMLIDQLWVR